ncbi:DNA ligase [Pseudomassariella vexata]|uniref:DNA ligase n=1 Tax=Pseudomassariella vexata TaxID=1141098 RepID=A0A1Y2DIJ3_9PEZI|nr:DNA ligase [Pseudomassariella vexata]ORY59047.1 DNA ligase [Pseudomassariella vexata]
MSQQRKRGRDPGAVDEELRQYTTGGQTLEELDKKYPNRPRNHSKTLLFSQLYECLFNPLNNNKKQPTGPATSRAKTGPHGPSKMSPQEQRRIIVERFISRWRAEVGDDFYPALRLIIPNQDRDRGVYGLKENNIGKILVKIMKIDKNSEDGYNLLHWKLPGQSAASRMAGDFAGRCYDVLSKRPMRTEVGDMRIAEVNEWLDKLSAASGEKEQLPIFEIFYQRMNPEELMWLIRIILKFMKVGATERTFFDIWHPDAEALFSVSSSLRRVCWELSDPSYRLNQEETNVHIMQCFQPQLAQFQFSGSFRKMVDSLTRANPLEDDNEYWIEEKLDGERMQMHMKEDSNSPGGFQFFFASRKGHDYTYLYGSNFEDEKSALSCHLKDAFAPGVRNLILDGEMVTWDMELDKIMNFGTLKTAALSEQKKLYSQNGARPLFRVFDILHLNGQCLSQYTLRDRRNALAKAVPGVHRRLEIHPYLAATSPDEIEPQLRKVVAEASEGLVLKNPRSMYRLNSRNDDWIKVKPEYLNDFGESVDVVIIGGYYGSGHRGGRLSSFLCGLRADENDITIKGVNPEKCYSFCKVGGGFRAEDYAEIRHHTEGKWHEWDRKNPPTNYIELGSGVEKQAEQPDVWIRPSESVVISVKAASAGSSEQFARGITLRFPRFKGLRLDKSWDSALDYREFLNLKKHADEMNKSKAMEMETRRRPTKRTKKEIVIAGQEAAPAEFDGPRSKVFEGLELCVLTESTAPKKTKSQLETLIKQNGGIISQQPIPRSHMRLIGEKKVVKVASMIKAGDVDVLKPNWVLDCIAQNFLLPEEPRHLFHVSDALKEWAAENVDEFGDSYARDLDVSELRNLLADMPKHEIIYEPFNKLGFLQQLEEHGHDFGGLKGHLFRKLVVYFARGLDVSSSTALKLENWVKFGGGRITEDLDDESITTVVVISSDGTSERELAAEVRSVISCRQRIPHVTSQKWIEDCWKESTLLDEERYAPM